jgi:uncharacterized protein (DUF1697 family)
MTMATYVGLLRAVNVGGRKLSMADLVRVTESVGGRDVRTYLQSGNVVFRGTKAVASGLAEALSDSCGFDVPVLLRTPTDFDRILSGQPFNVAEAELHVTFLDARPQAGLADAIDTSGHGSDRFVVAGKEVYLHCPGGYGRTKLNNTFWERKLKVRATTRNWRSVRALAEMAGAGT